MKSAVCSFMVLFVATMLCWGSGCGAPLKDRINNAPRHDDQRDIEERELLESRRNQIIQGLQRAADPQARSADRKGMVLYILLLSIGAVVIAGLVYWNLWRLKRMEWAQADPMALLQELFSVHQCSEQEKRLMQEVSEKNVLSSPLQLFIEPRFLLEAMNNDAFAPYRHTLRQLLLKLFDITIEDGGEASTVLSGAIHSGVIPKH